MYKIKKEILEIFFSYLHLTFLDENVEYFSKSDFKNENYYNLCNVGFTGIIDGLMPSAFDILLNAEKNRIIHSLPSSESNYEEILNLEFIYTMLKAIHQIQYQDIIDLFYSFSERPDRDVYVEQLEKRFAKDL